MSEGMYAAAGSASATSGFGQPEVDPVSAGMLLRAAREAAGLHIAALAVSLKVPVNKLEALEHDRSDLLPDAVFARALAATICRNLKVDPAPVLARLPQGGGHRLKASSSGAPTPFRASVQSGGSPRLAMTARPAVLAGLALCLGSLVLVFWPSLTEVGGRLGLATISDTPAISNVSGASEPLVLELTGPGETGPVVKGSTGSGEGKAALTSVTPSVFAATGPAPPAPSVQTQPTADVLSAANSALSSPAAGIVTFRVKAQSWIEVTDARGIVVLRRTLNAGESVGATGALPMAAVVGRADATQVEIRGKSVDLKPLSRENVARFEVK